jgi:hypothetical protein
MLTYVDSAVARNSSEKKINSLLDFISSSSDLELLQVCVVCVCGGGGRVGGG